MLKRTLIFAFILSALLMAALAPANFSRALSTGPQLQTTAEPTAAVGVTVVVGPTSASGSPTPVISTSTLIIVALLIIVGLAVIVGGMALMRRQP